MLVEQILIKNVLKNYTYVIYSKNDSEAYVIDPYCADKVIEFLESKGLNLKMILNTHSHFDHTRGNTKLISHYDCKVWKPKSEVITLKDSYSLESSFLPGHCPDHYCFFLRNVDEIEAFFAGDLIFEYGVGNTKLGGNMLELFKSISSVIAKTPKTAVFFPGHNYGESNLNFLKKYFDLPSIERDTNFGHQLSYNFFLRFNDLNSRKELAKSIGENSLSPFEYFTFLRTKRDAW